MSKDPLIGKIKKSILVLQMANFVAALAFFGGYFMVGDILFAVAGACMLVAFGGLFFLRKRILSKLSLDPKA